jgi:hypothetical protein
MSKKKKRRKVIVCNIGLHVEGPPGAVGLQYQQHPSWLSAGYVLSPAYQRFANPRWLAFQLLFYMV